MQITYGCGDTRLERARFLKFQKRAAKGKIDPDRLPPTEDAATQHALRVHVQFSVWQDLDTTVIDPVGKGWELQNNKMRPRMLSGDIAPQSLLKGICCNCQDGDKQCQKMKCCCLKDGMTCVAACGVCAGHCSNGEINYLEELPSDEDETS